MICKAFEIRDAQTFIPVLAVLMVPAQVCTSSTPTPEGTVLSLFETHEAERYLLRRAGFNFDNPCVILCRMESAGCDRNASYDPYAWGGSRTYTVAHKYIIEHWDELETGAVIDVEHILGESAQPKKSERETAPL